MWHHTGRTRPPFAIEPGPGQESVWDYPRPPRIEVDGREVTVAWGDEEIARSRRAFRVLETASPPTYYIPRGDVRMDLLEPAPGRSACEWKGIAAYWTVLAGGQRLPQRAWSYPSPNHAFAVLRDAIAFYPSPLVCTVDRERVRPQPGSFYAGWLTDSVVGPVKGDPGTEGW